MSSPLHVISVSRSFIFFLFMLEDISHLPCEETRDLQKHKWHGNIPGEGKRGAGVDCPGELRNASDVLGLSDPVAEKPVIISLRIFLEECAMITKNKVIVEFQG